MTPNMSDPTYIIIISRSWGWVCGVSMRQPQCGHPALGGSAGSRYHETSEWGALDVCPDVDPYRVVTDLKFLVSIPITGMIDSDIFEMSGCLLFGLNTSPYPISVAVYFSVQPEFPAKMIPHEFPVPGNRMKIRQVKSLAASYPRKDVFFEYAVAGKHRFYGALQANHQILSHVICKISKISHAEMQDQCTGA